jgi:hypothetical protein
MQRSTLCILFEYTCEAPWAQYTFKVHWRRALGSVYFANSHISSSGKKACKNVLPHELPAWEDTYFYPIIAAPATNFIALLPILLQFAALQHFRFSCNSLHCSTSGFLAIRCIAALPVFLQFAALQHFRFSCNSLHWITCRL